MLDAFGNPQSLLLVGGTSEIGLAAVSKINAQNSLRKVFLLGRNQNDLDTAANLLAAEFPLLDVQYRIADFSNPSESVKSVGPIFQENQIDIAILSAGILPRSQKNSTSFSIEVANVNFVSQLAIGNEAITHFKSNGTGTLITISSVAAVRPRADNYIYAATKAALDDWATGLSDSLVGTGVRSLVVRPSMVRTRMSEGMKEAPFTVNIDDVAVAIARKYTSNANSVWVPWPVGLIMFVLKNLPRGLYRKIASSR